ncbi:MAG: hypothetical protein D6731_22025 [Planctomycetota bacterium]|nr:MAG: hypothetical protein D6731_22025 [Planctomycetota bacterium]
MSPALRAFLDFVEWRPVVEAAARHASSAPGRERVLALCPAPELAEARLRQARTEAARTLLAADLPDFAPLCDLGAAFARGGEEGLGRRELYAAARTVLLGRDARDLCAGLPPLAQLLAGPAPDAGDLEAAGEVLNKIGPHGVVLDGASDRLAELRRALGAARAALAEALRRVCYDPRVAPALAERSPVSLRGQPCLKVRAGEVRRVPGPIVQQERDVLWVEPDAARAAYNQVRHLEVDERAEEARICRQLSTLLWPRREELSALADALAFLDAHLALARYGEALEATAPELLEPGARRLSLRGLRHPLLVAEGRCVPLDLELNGPRTVVVSGPNGGGKSACLKAVGLAVLLAQAGGLVPARAASLPVFASLRAVGPPRAGLEEGRSTFQAHAADLAVALEGVEPGALLLLDEVGTGTDPTEAAALGQAVLEHVLARGATVLATTHLASLKGFAERAEGAVNAAMGVDAAGRPTFALRVGERGGSHALDAAEAQGLPPSVCARARALHAGES